MGEHVVINYTREIEAPLAKAYAWLTDYQDTDPSLTTAIVKRRPVLERTANRVVLDGEIEVLGRRGKGRAIVDLHPPDHWVAHFEGRGEGTVYDYRLTPLGPAKCRLDVVYSIRVKRFRRRLLLWLGKGRARKEIDVMWDGFVANMQKDFAREAAAAGPAAAAQRATR